VNDVITVSLRDVANIVTFIAPGYFATQVYSLIYAKQPRDFSHVLIESVVYSLPIVTLVNIVWEQGFRQPPASSVRVVYVMLLLTIALAVGAAATVLRTKWPIKIIAAKSGLSSPNEDFVGDQFLRINTADPSKSSVTVILKDGGVFSATVDRLSRYTPDGPRYYLFTNLFWFNDQTGKWDERKGGIIIERNQIEYIETPPLRD
jgi:hypothetical protein